MGMPRRPLPHSTKWDVSVCGPLSVARGAYGKTPYRFRRKVIKTLSRPSASAGGCIRQDGGGGIQYVTSISSAYLPWSHDIHSTTQPSSPSK